MNDNNLLIPLEALIESGEIGSRESQVCKRLQIKYLEDMISYYHKESNFLAASSCGQITNLKLVNLCKKYDKVDWLSLQIDPKKEDYTGELTTCFNIEYLARYDKLPTKLIEFCVENHIDNLGGILYHGHLYKSFKNLNGCDYEIEKHLKKLCRKYVKLINKVVISRETEEIVIESSFIQAQKFDKKRRNIFDKYMDAIFSNLSERGQNEIRYLLGGRIELESFLMISTNIKLYNLDGNNILEKTLLLEVKNFISKIKRYIRKVTVMTEKDVIIQCFQNTYRKFFPDNTIYIKKIIREYSIKDGFPLFYTVYNIFKYGNLLEDIEKDIFFKILNVTTDNRDIYETDIVNNPLVKQAGGREYVEKFVASMADRVSQMMTCKRELRHFAVYGIDANLNYHFIDNNIVHEINEKERVRFNAQFITLCLSVLWYDTYQIFGNLECAFFNCEVNTKNSNLYLIKKELFEDFNFDKWYKMLNNALKRQGGKGGPIDITELYTFCFIDSEMKREVEIKKICNFIIKKEILRINSF